MQTRKHDFYDDYGCRRVAEAGFSPGIIPDRMRDMAPVPATFENAVIMKSWR